jgi:hypothetical protein
MAIQTSFAKKVTGFEDCDDGFFSLLGNNGQLDLAFLDCRKTASATSPCENTICPREGTPAEVTAGEYANRIFKGKVTRWGNGPGPAILVN